MENDELKERFIDKKTRIEYIRKGDYYFPNLIDSDSIKAVELGKYGHKDIQTTINTYTTIFDKFKKEQVDKYVEYMQNIN